MNHYDAVFIGFGKAAKTLAPQIASRGRKVAIVEKSPLMYGGTCPNVGCIPSKALITAAKEIHLASPDEATRQNLYQQAIARKNSLTSSLRAAMHQKMIDSGVEVIDGTGFFRDEKTLMVRTQQGERCLTSDKYFINTGSSSFIPPIKGIAEPQVYTSETLMNLTKLPQTLVIIGGGNIGLEFASMYANFGSKVVILQDLPEFMPKEDKDISRAIQSSLEQKGIVLHFGVRVEEIINKGNQAEVKFSKQGGEHSVHADAVLVATGRRPNIQELQLNMAGVEITANGAIKVDDNLRTTNPDIWAMGDVTGGLQFTYISLDDSRIVKAQLPIGEKKYTAADRNNIPYCVFLDPPYARVGLNEKEALEKNYNIKVARMLAGAVPRAKAIDETTGLLKAVVDVETLQILGVMLYCAESYEVINLVKLAMDQNLPYTELRDMIYTHPSMSEAFNELFDIKL